MYTAGITSNQFEGRGRTLTFADDVLLNNRAVKDEMPKVFISDKEINRVNVLPYLKVSFLTEPCPELNTQPKRSPLANGMEWLWLMTMVYLLKPSHFMYGGENYISEPIEWLGD